MRQRHVLLQKTIAISLMIGLVVFGYYRLSTPIESPQMAPEISYLKVNSSVMVRAARQPEARVFGHVVVPAPLRIRAKHAGEVIRVAVRNAEVVKAGQLLFEVDKTDTQRRLNQAISDKHSLIAREMAEKRNHQLDRDTLLQLEKQKESRIRSINNDIEAESKRQKSIKDTIKTQNELLMSLEKELTRQLVLRKKEVISDAVLDQAKRQVLQQKARLEELHGQTEQFSHATLRLQEAKTDTVIAFDQQKLQIVTRIDTHLHRVADIAASIKKIEIHMEALKDDLKEARYFATQDGKIESVRIAKGADLTPGELCMSILPFSDYKIHAQLPTRLIPSIAASLANREPLRAVLIAPDLALKHTDLTLTTLLAVSDAGVQKGVFEFDRQFDKSMVYDRLPVSVQVFLPSIENSYLIPITAIYPEGKVFMIDDDSRLLSQVVEEVGYVWQQGQPWALVTSRNDLDGKRVLSQYVPTAIDGLRVSTSTQS